jgi:hypothetical protein
LSSQTKSTHRGLAHKPCHPESFDLAQDKFHEALKMIRSTQHDRTEATPSDGYENRVVAMAKSLHFTQQSARHADHENCSAISIFPGSFEGLPA